MKKKLKTVLHVSLLCIALLFMASCTKDAGSNNKSKNDENATAMSGEEYFRGIFFVRGNFANKISMYKNINLYQNINIDQREYFFKVQEKSITDIKEIDPSFFLSFKRSVESGFNTDIDKALDNGAFLLIRTLERQPFFKSKFEQSKDELIIHKTKISPRYKIEDAINENERLKTNKLLSNNAVSSDPQNGAAFNVAIALNAAAAINVTVAVNVVTAVNVVIWKARWFWSVHESALFDSQTLKEINKYSGLQYEQLVHDVAIAASQTK